MPKQKLQKSRCGGRKLAYSCSECRDLIPRQMLLFFRISRNPKTHYAGCLSSAPELAAFAEASPEHLGQDTFRGRIWPCSWFYGGIVWSREYDVTFSIPLSLSLFL